VTQNRKRHTFTARMPVAEYEAVRLLAFASGTSINEVVVTAIRAHVQRHAGPGHDVLVEVSRERLGSALADVPE
jgi:hypothetical protein